MDLWARLVLQDSEALWASQEAEERGAHTDYLVLL